MRQITDIDKPSAEKMSGAAPGTRTESLRNRRPFFGLRPVVGVFAMLALAAGAFYVIRSGGHRRLFSIGNRTPIQESFPYLTQEGYGVYRPDAPVAAVNASAALEIDDSGLADAETLDEASAMKKSDSGKWWLNSGGVAYFWNREFSTNLGPLDKKSDWKKLYAKNNPTDTDQGYFPQNIFRLVTRSKAKDFTQTVRFNVQAMNLSESKNRNQSNGVLFFGRYQDGDNLYYAGIRVDGDAVIKKKYDGKYYTLAEKKVFPGVWDHETDPTLIPLNTWIGIRSEIRTVGDDTVDIRLSVDTDGQGWKPVIETTDTSDRYGDGPILSKGYAGIRTDFMDVRFKDYSIEDL